MGKGNKMLSVIFISFRSGWFAMLDQSLVRSTKHCLYTLLQYLQISALVLYDIAELMLMSEHPLRECTWWDIAAIWEKATRCCLWFSFSYVQDDLQCPTSHRVVPASTFSLRLWGALLISIWFVRYCSVNVDVRTPIKGVLLMRHIAAIWEKATRCCLWFSHSFLQDNMQGSTNHWCFPPSTVFMRFCSAFRAQHWFLPLLQSWC